MKGVSYLVALVLLQITIASYSQGTPTKAVSFATEVKPAVEAAVCVNSKQIKDMTFFTCAFEGCAKPDASPLQTKLSVEASKLFLTYPLLTSQLFGKIQASVPKDPESLNQIQSQFRSALLSDKTLQSALMPKLRAALATEGLVCNDCPGPEVVALSRAISKQEIMPYLMAFLWPSRVMPNGGVAFMVCVGSNGLSKIESADPTLSEAAFSCLNMNQEVMAMTASTIKVATADEGYKSLTDNEAKLSNLRAYLAKVLPTDPAFAAFIQKQLAEKLPAYGLICTDCAAPTAAIAEPK